jgi:hypothetical protein
MSYANEGRISVNMDAGRKEKLDAVAAARGMSRNALIVELIDSLPEPMQVIAGVVRANRADPSRLRRRS